MISQDSILLQVLFKTEHISYASSIRDSGQTKLHRIAVEDRHKESTKKNATLTDIVTPNSLPVH